MFKKIKNNIKQFNKDLKRGFKLWAKEKYSNFRWYNWLIYITIIIFFIVSFIFPLIPIIILLIVGFVYLVAFLNTSKFLKNSSGNGIIYGGRGRGKGLLTQIKAKHLKKYYSNVPMGYDFLEFEPKEYFNSIAPNTNINAIDNDINIVKKLEKFEAIPILFDDTAVYAPNFMDSTLKKVYPSMPLMLAINRHLYNHYMIITVQDRERPYKILKELQSDFSMKALKTSGFGLFWRSIPILRNYVRVKYRYYEEVKSAEAGVLPFKAKNVTGEALKHGYLTAGQATKEQFEAMHGLVYHGSAWIKKSNLKYDTRYFHQVFFNEKAPSNN